MQTELLYPEPPKPKVRITLEWDEALSLAEVAWNGGSISPLDDLWDDLPVDLKTAVRGY
jgi:hypothetical protein